ncbi:MAG: DoxX family protein [Acidobacteriota bacterium]|nr:DoxX family protein [Acidobacteriota bacterium]MDH3785368.1 DoxX family protein [Acidobacteriota bacterium]
MPRGFKIPVIIVSVLLGLWFLLAGAQKFMARAAFETMFSDLGLPLAMVPLIGILEVIGAILVFIPRTALFGAGLIFVVMLGAVASHLISGSGSPVPALIALLMAGFVGSLRFRALRYN